MLNKQIKVYIIPQKNTSIIWALKGDIKLLVCENRDRLIM